MQRSVTCTIKSQGSSLKRLCLDDALAMRDPQSRLCQISHDVDPQSADSAEGIPPTAFLIAMVSF